MTHLKLVEPAVSDPLESINKSLEGAPAETVLAWARDTFGGSIIMTSSFGADSALMLHLVTRVIPDIRVVFLDTGYLFPETYRFAEELKKRFNLDLRVYSPLMTAARQEALYGRLWEGDQRSLELYQQINKVEPMDRALRELAPRAWIAGLRRSQNAYRASLRRVELQDGVHKIHPILDWDDEAVHRYMRANDLPYHPLRARGYRSIGDAHSTFPTREDEDPRKGRHLGVHSECGIHLPRWATDESLKSSGL
ncbi:MAG: phosphoadenylyl-sulfate reductase [Pseudomonadota bacterium]|nr:MAG: phosphoadenylyl-sulfate reductase [Pseudomonadota bacterium]